MTREEAVRALVSFDRPLDTLRAAIKGFPFDWGGPPLGILRRDDLLDVLTRWKAGKLTNNEVEDWANLVEVREDLDHDPADPAVAQAIFDLANPVLQGPLEDIGPALLQRLQA